MIVIADRNQVPDTAPEPETEITDNPFVLSLSIGIIQSADEDEHMLDRLVQAADSEMYKNKSAHKGFAPSAS